MDLSIAPRVSVARYNWTQLQHAQYTAFVAVLIAPCRVAVEAGW